MATFWILLVVAAVVCYFVYKNRTNRAEQQRRQTEYLQNKAIQKPKFQANGPPKKRISGKAQTFKGGATTSKPRGARSAPTYKGPSFAQPGEKGDLFAYASFSGRNEIDAPFSLIDFETSGFQPGNGRILEVAVLKIDSEGQILNEYSTLVNPGNGNVGPTHIHRIDIGMVKNAPRFSDIAGDLINLLDSSIIVAHNARFEEKFLQSAFMQAGISHPLIPTIDTLWLSRQVLHLPNYKLGTIIDDFGFDFEYAHTALGDVRAMAKVFPQMLVRAEKIKYPVNFTKPPVCTSTGKTLQRRSSA